MTILKKSILSLTIIPIYVAVVTYEAYPGIVPYLAPRGSLKWGRVLGVPGGGHFIFLGW